MALLMYVHCTVLYLALCRVLSYCESATVGEMGCLQIKMVRGDNRLCQVVSIRRGIYI